MALTYARAVAKFEKTKIRRSLGMAAKRAADAAWALLSGQVADRDKHTCRVCGCQTVRWGVGNPKFWGQAHHIVYRSAGGLDELMNLVWLCFQCHDKEHRHEIDITGTASNLSVKPGPCAKPEARA